MMHQHASNRTRHGKRKVFEMKRGDWWVVTNGGGGRGARRLARLSCAHAHVAAARRAANVSCHSRAASDKVSVPSCPYGVVQCSIMMLGGMDGKEYGALHAACAAASYAMETGE